MKVYSIGREEGCDIVVNDSTDVVSRRHAIINVSPSGKMTIVDQSQNGTYVNGIRISPNVPVPIKRTDNVSFAHIARLDWKMVPNPNVYIKYSILGLIAVVIIIGGVFGYNMLFNNSTPLPDPQVTADSLSVKMKQKKMMEGEKLRKDSIQKHAKDSVEKANAAKKKTKKKEEKKVEKKPAENTPPKDAKKDNTQKRFH